MTSPVTCETVRDDALVERYVTQRLPEEQAAAFEAHYLLCAQCQADLEAAAVIRGMPRPRRRVTALVAGLAAAAAVALLVMPWRGERARLAGLGAVPEPPLYLGVPVRATPAAADSLFGAGMNAYGAGRYDDAVAVLSQALASGAAPAPAEFFRAAAHLMQDRDGEAAEGFERVIALGRTAYLAEARYYAAKALLRRGERSAAARHLAAVPGDHAIAPLARGLRDSIEVRPR